MAERIRYLDANFVIIDTKSFLGKTRGWMVGSFMEKLGFPALADNNVEIAYMRLPEVDPGKPHFHKTVTEYTFVVSGELTMVFEDQTRIVREGEIMIIPPRVISQNPRNSPDTVVIVVKHPSDPTDKFYVE